MAGSRERRWPCNKWSDEDNRIRLVPTLYLLMAYIAMGFISAQRGSAFLDIQLITNTTLRTASFFFTASAIGGLIGAFVFGRLYARYNKNLVIFFTVLGMSITVAIIPHCSDFAAMIIAWFCNTFFMGGFDASASADVVRMWSADSQTYLFLVNVGFSCGAVLAPLLTEPFLISKELLDRTLNLSTNVCPNITSNENMTYVSIAAQNTSSEIFVFGDHYSFQNKTTDLSENATICINSSQKPEVDIQLHYAYVISSILALLTSLPLLYQVSRSRQMNTGKMAPSGGYSDILELPRRHFVAVIFIVLSIYIFTSGIEDSFSSFLLTFVVEQLNWTKTQGAQLSSIFFGAHTVVRVLGIFYRDLFSPTLLLLGSIITLILSVGGIAACSIYVVHIGVWILIGICGFLIGILVPIGINWINKDIVSVSGKVSWLILVGSATGKLCNPIVLGYFMEEYSPMCFCYIILLEAFLALSILLFATIYSQNVLVSVRRRKIDQDINIKEKTRRLLDIPTIIITEAV